jgi:hypothetical protein
MTIVTETMLFIEVDTGKYPVYLSTIRAQFQQTISFGGIVPIEDVTGLGFAPVADSVVPTGDVVTEGAPVLVDGGWQRTWIVRAYTPAELSDTLAFQQNELSAQIQVIREQDFNQGVPFTFNGEVMHVQVDPGSRVNLLYLNAAAQQRLAAGSTDTEPFRSYENKSYLLPPQALLDMTNTALPGYKLILSASWAVKDAVDAAVKVEDLPTLPTSFLATVTPA